MIDLLAISAIDRDTEMSYVRRERDWLTRAQADGRASPPSRLLPMLPAGARRRQPANGNGERPRPHGWRPRSGHLHAQVADRPDA